MSYIDYFLQFNSESESIPLTSGPDMEPPLVHVDVIGEIVTFNGDGTPTALPGWHVNVRSVVEIPGLEPYRVFPATPYRTWA